MERIDPAPADPPEEEFFLRESQRAGAIGSYRLDLATGAWVSSPVLDSILGIDGGYRRDLTGWLDLVHPDMRPVMEHYLKVDVRSGRRLFSGEYRIIRVNDGETRWVSGRGEVKFGADGAAASVGGTIRDISTAKEAEQQLRTSEATLRDSRARLERAESVAQFGNWELDLAARKMLASAGARAIYGLPSDSWPLDEVQRVPLPEYRAMLDAALRGLIQENRPYNVEFRIRRPADGELRDIHSIAEYEPGRRLVFGVVHDITERKRLETSLERRVLERTAQLQAANQELEAFSYSVSHDLRAPLRSIEGFSQAMLEDCQERLDETGRHYLERIRQATRRMEDLIGDLLELSRTNRGELAQTEFDLSALCRKVAAELASGSPERRVEVVVQPGLRARADRRLLKVALDNLLGNAWKFTSRRQEPRIEVGEAAGPGPGRTFFIRDNGAGFDMALAGKMFSAFQRLHPAEQFDCTGIGLAIVQRILHRHGGRVWATGAPDMGATFFFTIPD